MHPKVVAQESAVSVKSQFDVIEITGEAISSSTDEISNDRTRIAAILDAMRKYVMSRKYDKTKPDTLKCAYQWDTMDLRARTIQRRGIAISDTVSLHFNGYGKFLSGTTWQSSNLVLTHPNALNDRDIDRFIEVLSGEGITIKMSYPLAANLWQEVVLFNERKEDED